ncbi:MAG: DNA lyase [Nanoarchaeota archaeon]|nr:DNA lyase [Nanoarchaeota archaeon]|tara:strand:- start:1023 stop:1610 length:588 start_codon:yes stop_codon:yes gene_type:complete
MDLRKHYNSKKLEIETRLNDFKQLNEEDLFYELCFCLLTPQSKAKNADYCIQKLKSLNFRNKNLDPVPILKQKIRFHNNKGRYLLELKKNYSKLKEKLENTEDKRKFLVKNVKGLGLKEASHYLRNTGHENFAILDRHILKNLNKLNIIELPKTLTPSKYIEIEEKFKDYSKKIKIPMDHLDLLFWSEETGEIFK